MNITFTPLAFEEYNNWFEENEDVFYKIRELIKNISREPFKGIGKPEPLKGNYKGYWSRRINLEHRLIYSVDKNSVFIISCKGHYK